MDLLGLGSYGSQLFAPIPCRFRHIVPGCGRVGASLDGAAGGLGLVGAVGVGYVECAGISGGVRGVSHLGVAEGRDRSGVGPQ